jgi:deoxyhypusine synthase
VRTCPDPERWGGLSGCSDAEEYRGEIRPPEAERGRFAEVHADAAIAWPLAVRAGLRLTA